MKITPLEIRQKQFEKKLRGYDKDDVNAFLASLSSEWERMIDENKELKIKLDQAEKEVRKLREVESSLFKTLKTAEDTGANMIDQANKAAELHLKETEMNAEAMLSESKSKAKAIIEDAELKAKELIVEMQEAIKDLEKNYRTIENHRDNLILELDNLAKDILEKLSRTSDQKSEFKVEDHLIKVRKLVRESEDRINKEQLSVAPRVSEPIPVSHDDEIETRNKLKDYIEERDQAKESPQEVRKEEEDGLSGDGSFFDQVGS